MLHRASGTKQRYNFTCNDWLKGICEKKLQLGAGAGGMCTYRVVVTTSDVRNAGTDADVSIVMYGENGDSGERMLENSTNNFEKGKVSNWQKPICLWC